jgi:hypothetical protein
MLLLLKRGVLAGHERFLHSWSARSLFLAYQSMHAFATPYKKKQGFPMREKEVKRKRKK